MDLAGARALLRERGVVTLTAAPGVPSLVEAIAGAPVRGSWWGHPKGKLIFNVSSALAEHEDVLALKLVDR